MPLGKEAMVQFMPLHIIQTYRQNAEPLKAHLLRVQNEGWASYEAQEKKTGQGSLKGHIQVGELTAKG